MYHNTIQWQEAIVLSLSVDIDFKNILIIDFKLKASFYQY